MEEQHEPDINKVVSSNKSSFYNHKIIKYIAMGVFILLPFIGFYLGMEYQKQIYNSQESVVEISIKDSNTIQEENIEAKEEKEQDKTRIIEEDSLFAVSETQLLLQSAPVSITPESGFIVITSILSSSQDKVVYGEITDCIYFENDNDNETTCPWIYKIKVKDLLSGNIDTLFIYDSSVEPPDHFVWLPMDWSINDKKIMLEGAYVTEFSGGGSRKGSGGPAIIDVTGGDIEELARYNHVFVDNNRIVITTKSSELSPQKICDFMDSPSNNGKIIAIDIESGQEVTLLEAANTEYSLLFEQPDADNILYEYRAVDLSDTDGSCGYASMSPKQSGKIRISDIKN